MVARHLLSSGGEVIFVAAISNEIYIGSLESPSFYFTNADILSASGEYAVDLIGDELSIDRFTPTTRYTYVVQQIFQPADHERKIQRRIQRIHDNPESRQRNDLS